jgi:hypothetical protein
MKQDNRGSTTQTETTEQALKQVYQMQAPVVPSDSWTKDVMREICEIPQGVIGNPIIELSAFFWRTGLAAAAAAAVVLVAGTFTYMADRPMRVEIAQYQVADVLGFGSATLLAGGKE